MIGGDVHKVSYLLKTRHPAPSKWDMDRIARRDVECPPGLGLQKKFGGLYRVNLSEIQEITQ